jgi:micrococcal nuclease
MATVARFVVSLASAVALGAPGGLACDLPAGEIATVAAVTDGETMQLSNGRTVRLGGVKAPAPPLGWKGEEPWPLVRKPRTGSRGLSQTARKSSFGLTSAGRIGMATSWRRSISLRAPTASGCKRRSSLRVWRGSTSCPARACAAALLVHEAVARDARRGLWHSWAYRVRDATDVKGLGRLTQTYQVVQGTVHAVGESQKRLYVNFAPDWRNDFTIVIERKRLARFEAAGLDFDRLDGARVRVRGWVEWWNGPMIAASDPEQIEVLSPAPAM